MIRHSYHDLFTSLGVGMRYDKRDKVRYTLRGKKSFLVTNDDSVNFVIKGRYDVDQEFKGVPYLQIRENNWTLNADMNGRWNIRFDL